MGGDGHGGAEAAWSPRLRAVVAHLWNPSERVLVTTRREPVPAYREIDSYLVVVSPARAQFLVPLSAGRVAATASLLAYNRLRPRRTRLLRTVVARGVRTGLLPMRHEHRLRILVPSDLPAAELASVSPTHWLAAVLGTDPVTAALAVPAATPNAKPTLQLFAVDGSPVGYAKLSWNESTRRQVRNEAQNSARFEPLLHRVKVPAVLALESWRGFEAVVTAPMPADGVAWGVDAPPPPLAVTAEIAATSGPHDCLVGDSPQVRRLAEQIDVAGTDAAAELRNAMRDALTKVTQRWGGHSLRHGAWHGDWVPWNVARAGTEIIGWDWEHSSDDVPVGFDLLHWHFQVWFIHHRKPLHQALTTMRRAAARAVAELQGSPESVAPCAALYTLELSARYLGMHEAGAGWNPRFSPAILAELRDLAS